MSDDKQKAVDRVRKLLALSSSPNENEAMAAANKAHAIMAEYNLTQGDLSEAERAATGFVTDNSTRTDSRPWRRSLAVMTAEMFFSKYWFMFDYDRDSPSARARKCKYVRYDIHCFIGEPQNVGVVVSMFQYLDETITRLAREGSRSVSAKGRASYQTSFMHACATRVCHRIRQRIDDAKRGGVVQSSTGNTLPALASLYERKLAEVGKELATIVPNMKTHNARTKINDVRGAVDGREAGDKIGLDTQLGRSRPSGLLQ